MKILAKILLILGTVVLILLSAVLVFIEARTLFSGDLALAQNVVSAVTANLCRIFALLFLFFFGVYAISNFKTIRSPLFYFALGFTSFGIAMVSFWFYEWFIGLGLGLGVLLAGIPSLIAILRKP